MTPDFDADLEDTRRALRPEWELSSRKDDAMALTSARNGCPVCRAALASLSSEPVAEARCPRCEAELWAVGLRPAPFFFVRLAGESAAEFITALAGPALGASGHEVASFLWPADSLDMIEFWEELRGALGLFGSRVAS
jgi:hypothetical protein